MPACVIETDFPKLETILRELELKAATEKTITCSEIVNLRLHLQTCLGKIHDNSLTHSNR